MRLGTKLGEFLQFLIDKGAIRRGGGIGARLLPCGGRGGGLAGGFQGDKLQCRNAKIGQQRKTGQEYADASQPGRTRLEPLPQGQQPPEQKGKGDGKDLM